MDQFQAGAVVGRVGKFRSSAGRQTRFWKVAKENSKILQGTRTIKRIGLQTWDEVYAGLVPFDAEGWLITFFNDCSDLDYCHECTCPDGRKGEFDSWYDAGTEPVMLLDDCERFQLEQILKSA